MKKESPNRRAGSVRQVRLILGDSFVVMTGIPGNSIGAVVTDPPYG